MAASCAAAAAAASGAAASGAGCGASPAGCQRSSCGTPSSRRRRPRERSLSALRERLRLLPRLVSAGARHERSRLRSLRLGLDPWEWRERMCGCSEPVLLHGGGSKHVHCSMACDTSYSNCAAHLHLTQPLLLDPWPPTLSLSRGLLLRASLRSSRFSSRRRSSAFFSSRRRSGFLSATGLLPPRAGLRLRCRPAPARSPLRLRRRPAAGRSRLAALCGGVRRRSGILKRVQ